METFKRYRKKADRFVVAVRLDLDTDGFTYRKWGAEQCCKRGDWLVDNDGDIYSVDGDVFAKTYRRAGPGVYVKTAPVWAEIASASGSVVTKEGRSLYEAGDYLVYNNQDGTDAYCISAEKFEALYEPDEER
ncbi:MAG: hypothetical protein U5R30_16675 [Deltaproteobacteria bacterium]|nr:hypothetical protein [Deltaproteobacteria bacterium]